jgi:dimethylglycine dehydrogenase
VLKAKGAVFEEVYGFERPRWFARGEVAQEDQYSFKRNQVFDIVGAEVRAVRNNVGIMDVTAFTKVEVSGAGAYDLLDRLVANRMPQRDGAIILTHLLNRRGRIEIEATVVRMARDRFYIVCAAFFEQRLLDHLNHHSSDETVSITALSSSWAALAIAGPKARKVLQKCTDADLSNAAFRWLSAQQITVAGREVWAFRMSYAGELGWELHMPFDAALDVYNALSSAGEPFGVADYGSFAMNVMRMEKAFPGAGELTNEVTLPEANVMRFVRPEKEFLGAEQTRTSLAQQQSGTMPWACAYLEIEPNGIEDGTGGEAVLLNGQVVGSTASVAYGHTVGKILAFAYLKPHANVAGQGVEVIIAGRPRKGRVLSRAAYDPENHKPRSEE